MNSNNSSEQTTWNLEENKIKCEDELILLITRAFNTHRITPASLYFILQFHATNIMNKIIADSGIPQEQNPKGH